MEATIYERHLDAAVEKHYNREFDRINNGPDAPCMYDRVLAAVQSGANIQMTHGSVPVITEITADAIGDAALDRIMQSMVALSMRPIPNDEKIGQLFRHWLSGAITDYAAALDRAEARGVSVSFNNEVA